MHEKHPSLFPEKTPAPTRPCTPHQAPSLPIPPADSKPSLTRRDVHGIAPTTPRSPPPQHVPGCRTSPGSTHDPRRPDADQRPVRTLPPLYRGHAAARPARADGAPLLQPARQSVVKGKSVSVRSDLGGSRNIKKNKLTTHLSDNNNNLIQPHLTPT